MTVWYRMRRVSDGAVVVTAGLDLDAYPGWNWLQLDREPGEFDAIGDDGSVTLDIARADAKLQADIDAAAGAFRCRFITDTPGQQATYLDKEAQARAFIAGGAEPAAYARITAEAAVRGISEADMAALVVATADAWRALDVAIEARRIEAKLAVAAAETLEAKRAAAAVDWPALAPAGGE